MKMQKISAILATTFIVLMTITSEAAIIVSNVVCQQQYPWNGKVNIEYEVFGNEDDTNIWISASGYDHASESSIVMKTLFGEGIDSPVRPGKHVMIWDAKTDCPGLKTDYFTATLTAYDFPQYMVVDLSEMDELGNYSISYLYKEPNGGWTEEYKTTKLVLRFIQPGTFTMGSPVDEIGRNYSYYYRDNETQHEVTLTQPYYIGVFELTQKQYELITGHNPSYIEGDARPVEGVTYNDIRGEDEGSSWPSDDNVDEGSFLGMLRSKSKLAFDLPTHAQWEYACRAGMATSWNDGTNITNYYSDGNLDKLGRYYSNMYDDVGGYSGYCHTTVGSYLPNSWGLYDMHGNVWEWCLDWYSDFTDYEAVADPVGNDLGDYRVACGGGFWSDAYACRAAYSIGIEPDGTDDDFGFRLALVMDDDYLLDSREITYSTSSASGSTFPVFEVKFYGKLPNGKEYLLEEMGKLSGDGSIGILFGSGEHKLIWTPYVRFIDLMNDIEIRVEIRDITESSKYLVLDLDSYKLRPEINGPLEDPAILTNDLCRTNELWLKRIEPGTFMMGSDTNEIGRSDNEFLHKVTLTKAYYIGVFEITQGQFKHITGHNPAYTKGDTFPVYGVSYATIRGKKLGAQWPQNHNVDARSTYWVWDEDYDDDGYNVECPTFLHEIRKNTGNCLLFDLPTQAQWEYACRATTTSSWNNGATITNTYTDGNLDKLGWYWNNTPYDEEEDWFIIQPVGKLAPNLWGLYDMHGGVAEWCLDWYRYDYEEDDVKDPKGLNFGTYRTLCGGDWYSSASGCRSSSFYAEYPIIDEDWDGESFTGFRVVLLPPENEDDDEQDELKQTFKYSIDQNHNSTLPVFKTDFYGKTKDGAEYLLEDIGTLSGDGSSGIILGVGRYELTWTPFAAYTNLIDKLELVVKYEDVTDDAVYLVLNMENGKMRTAINGPKEDISILTNDTCRTTDLWFRRIEAGTFMMGSPTNEYGRYSNEVQHKVNINTSFYIGIFEFTQKQFEQVADFNISAILGECRPVDHVSYDTLRGSNLGALWPNNRKVDDSSFLGMCCERFGMHFDLPTEAQWEYACRAGTTTSLNNGTEITNNYNYYSRDLELEKLGLYQGNHKEWHAVVGSFLPNAWGLYDMHGNVYEWCLDWYYKYYQYFNEDDPVGNLSGKYRILRGGSFWSYPNTVRSAYRDGDSSNESYYNIGFRMALLDNEKPKQLFKYFLEPIDDKALPFYTVEFYGIAPDGTEYLLKDIGNVLGDGVDEILYGSGEYRIIWEPYDEYTNLIDNIDFKWEYSEVSTSANYLILDLQSSKISFSDEGPMENASILSNDVIRTTQIWLRRIEPGTFTMGSPNDELGKYNMEDEILHEVVLTKPFYIGVFEITQKQYELLTGNNPSQYLGDSRPVESVSYDLIRGSVKGACWPTDNEVDEDSFLGKLRTKFKAKFDLPTEAQWEFACRAGTVTAWNNGTDITGLTQDSELDKLGRYYYNYTDGNGGYSNYAHTAVGFYQPNAWGLYDMHGNVWEWCLDWYSDYSDDSTDPKGAYDGNYRVRRGGSFNNDARNCRAAYRLSRLPSYCEQYLGFRIVIVP